MREDGREWSEREREGGEKWKKSWAGRWMNSWKEKESNAKIWANDVTPRNKWRRDKWVCVCVQEKEMSWGTKSTKTSKELRKEKEWRAEVNDFADFIIEIVNPVDTEGGLYSLKRSPVLPPPRTETDEIITAISTTAIHN